MGLSCSKILLTFLLVCTLMPSNIFADYDLRKDKKKQILNYKNDVEKLQKEIRENEILADQYRTEIDDLASQLKLLTKFIGDVESNGLEDKDSLLMSEIEINKIKEKLDPLRENFKKKVIWLYKYGRDYESEVLFSSRSLDDLYGRMVYLNKISGIRKKEFEKIKENRFLIEEKKKMLSLQARQRLGFIASKKEDQRTLYEKKILTENLISKLQDINTNYTRQIERLNEKISKIESRLNNLNTEFIYKISRQADYSGVQFEQLKGRLILPVQSVDIIEDFGTQMNQNTLAVSYNNGIDVSIAKGSEVVSVADGVVESVSYIPSIGDVIIINHGNEYRTVYGLIDNIAVSVGDEVTAGKVIAFTSDNLDGQSFHFELWKDKEPQNPKFWFSRN
ncbi:MAG: peptidoglycan DD-metalloendopeptidase family protein [Ignavibacteriae bacterium]|nr:peptidoglycan DD-metalloendopeptidase family protein [Ignavibacteriota bacterium]MCB9243428.1 peptidoglycan DD-metalloendopeptidase family protein [Ignavibacteriales bacterium]